MLNKSFFALALSASLLNANAQDFIDITKQSADKNATKISISGYLGGFDYSKIALYTKAEQLKVYNAAGINFDSIFVYSAKLKALKNLEITGCRFNALPNSLALVSQIEHLNLSNNSLSAFATQNLHTLPDAITKLNLRSLDLSQNGQLDSIAILNQLAKLPNLKILRLAQCEMQSLPSAIGSLKALKVLDLRGNALSSLPEAIGNLTELEELNLSVLGIGLRNNKLTKLPQSIGNLTKLKKLDLKGNSLTGLPANFSQLQQLEYLDFEQNSLPDFPASLTKLTKLTYLNLNQNTLINLPANIGDLSNLVELRLDNIFRNHFSKKIKNLPLSITKLSKLQVLTLRDNVIEELPENIGYLSHLQHLDLRDNLFSSLPESLCELKNLRYLNLKANELILVPTCIGQLGALEDLTLAFNPALKVERYFSVIKDLKNLKFLDVSYNNLSKEQLSVVINELPNCRIVNLGASDKGGAVPQESMKGQEFWNSAPPDRKK